MGHVVVKLFHTIPGVTWSGQKHNTLSTPRLCLCQRVFFQKSPSNMDPKVRRFSAPSWELVKPCVNVSVSPLGLCAGNGRVESVFLCVGEGFQKAKGCEIPSGDHPSYESSRLAEVFALFAFMREL